MNNPDQVGDTEIRYITGATITKMSIISVRTNFHSSRASINPRGMETLRANGTKTKYTRKKYTNNERLWRAKDRL